MPGFIRQSIASNEALFLMDARVKPGHDDRYCPAAMRTSGGGAHVGTAPWLWPMLAPPLRQQNTLGNNGGAT
ncbi:MAG TPA: hypothetical protein VE258_16735, partial [Ktedonobacterales bacterium]|nr:hypothetical protein [Ktedonobacterales bacterium]